MKLPKLTPEQQKRVDEQHRKYLRNLQLRPVVSDEDFLKETEATDEQYKRGLTLPGAK